MHNGIIKTFTEEDKSIMREMTIKWMRECLIELEIDYEYYEVEEV